MKPEKNTPHAVRALINRLLRASLDWVETITDVTDDSVALSAKTNDVVYIVMEQCGRLTLYCIGTDGVPEEIASSDDPSVAPELLGLFRHADYANEVWISQIRNSHLRQNLGHTVSLHDLFDVIDDPRRLCRDAADERAYLAQRAGKIVTTDEILKFRRRAYTEAMRHVKDILRQSPQNALGVIIPVDDTDVNPLNWRVTLLSGFPGYLTDLHTKVCPSYYDVDLEGGDNARETAVKIAAEIVLLSLLEVDDDHE